MIYRPTFSVPKCRSTAIHVLLRHIQPYCGIFRTLCNSWIFRALSYWESWYTYLKAYSERSVTLGYWDLCHIQNFVIFRILACLGPEAYSESCLYRHIEAYSSIFDNDNYNNVNFFFHFNLTYSSMKLKKKTCLFDLEWGQFQCST